MGNKIGAMEFTVGTIVTIVLLMSALVLGLILTRTIFVNTTTSVNTINDQVTGEINNLFGEDGTGFVVKLGNENTAKVKQGTENFGIPIGFSPTNPLAWGTAIPKVGCKYTITPLSGAQYCSSKGWTNPCDSIETGCTNVQFETFENSNGYSLIKINIPENVPPCLQRFSISVTCVGYPLETIQNSFDIEVLKKGVF